MKALACSANDLTDIAAGAGKATRRCHFLLVTNPSSPITESFAELGKATSIYDSLTTEKAMPQ